MLETQNFPLSSFMGIPRGTCRTSSVYANCAEGIAPDESRGACLENNLQCDDPWDVHSVLRGSSFQRVARPNRPRARLQTRSQRHWKGHFQQRRGAPGPKSIHIHHPWGPNWGPRDGVQIPWGWCICIFSGARRGAMTEIPEEDVCDLLLETQSEPWLLTLAASSSH